MLCPLSLRVFAQPASEQLFKEDAGIVLSVGNEGCSGDWILSLGNFYPIHRIR